MDYGDLDRDDWCLEYGGIDLLILGLGRLRIALPHFDLQAVSHEEDMGSDVIGGLVQRRWCYTLPDGVDLRLISTGNPHDPDAPELHQLFIGDHVMWEMPETFAEALHACHLPTREDGACMR